MAATGAIGKFTLLPLGERAAESFIAPDARQHVCGETPLLVSCPRSSGCSGCGRTSLVDRESCRIRRYQPDDLDDLYRICLLTADNGRDATALFRDPRLPGHVYAAPYAVFEPSLALVAEDAAGVGGYIVAALDSRAFQERLEQDWWPALRARYPEPPPEVAEVLSLPERHALHNIRHPWGTDDELARSYPSHLHINLTPRMQRRGIGRQLIVALVSGLRGQGSPGVHLMVGHANQRAAGFYRHVGFTELPATDLHIFAMKITDPHG
jgi:ribosomal protein S18 acetylase RimI-like enzyme